MNHIGDQTPQATFLTVEVHKLHKEFSAAAPVKIGQPVKLTADGEITPLLAADAAYLKIGDSIHNAAAGGLATIMMRGHVEMTVEAAAAQDAGPVKWTVFNTPTLRNRYGAAADAATTQGHSLEKATAAGQMITVVMI